MRQLLAWDCKYEYTRTLVGKRWHESTSIVYPGMERVNLQTKPNTKSKPRPKPKPDTKLNP